MLPRYIREMRRCNINASHEIFVAILPFISLARSVHYTEGRGRLHRGEGGRNGGQGRRQKKDARRPGGFHRGNSEDRMDERGGGRMVTPVGWWAPVGSVGVPQGLRTGASVAGGSKGVGAGNLHFTLHLKRLS